MHSIACFFICCMMLFLGMTPCPCHAQEIRISGAIKDSATNSPIQDAVVYLLRNRLADTTKSMGNFVLSGTPLSIKYDESTIRVREVSMTDNGSIRLRLLEKEKVRIKTFSIQGRLVHSFTCELQAGDYIVPYNRFASGICLSHIIIGDQSYVLTSVLTSEASRSLKSQTELTTSMTPVAKRAATGFMDTIVVSASGYDEKRVEVSKQIVFGLRIKCLKATIPQSDPVSDIDGNSYKTIVIGTQTWMAENLRSTRYSDSMEISLVSDGNEWTKLTTPAYCWYDNDPNNGKSYGALYNWYTADSSNIHKLAPKGWHIATDSDWNALETYLGGWSVAGGKMKEAATVHWRTPNTGATNETGFAALPGGQRSELHDLANDIHILGAYLDMGYVGWWWSSTSATCRKMQSDDASMYHGGYSAFIGAGVRCVKD